MSKGPILLFGMVMFWIGYFGRGYDDSLIEKNSNSVSVPDKVKDQPPKIFITHPLENGKRVVASLRVNRMCYNGKNTDYFPSNPDEDWYVEIDSIVYLCSPK